MATPSIDLATELGETFFFPPAGLTLDILRTVKNQHGEELHPRHTSSRHDDALLDVISTGYVACGAHSGDAVVMAETIQTLVKKGKAVGAHPSYPDIFGFGQKTPQNLSHDGLFSLLLAQLASAQALALAAGTRLTTVKCHGALSFDVAKHPEVANILFRAIKAVGEDISVVIFAGAPGVEAAKAFGIKVVREAYIDRRYDATGTIMSRKLPNSLITDADEAVEQALSIILKGSVIADTGEMIPMHADSLCLHGDTPNSGSIIEKLKKALRDNNIQVACPIS